MLRALCISCSGGGALGVGPARFLSNLEMDLGKKVSNMTVGYSGTSTGAIIAACLNEGMSALDVFELYKQNLKSIFKKYSVIDKVTKAPCPKYDNSYLKKLLQDRLKGKMSDFNHPIFIPSFNTISIRNPEKIFDRGDTSIDKWFAVLASTSAQTYFYPAGTDKAWIDGGNFANNPIALLAAGMIDSRKSSYNKDNIKILHLDTGMTVDKKGKGGNRTLLGWGTYTFKTFVARSNQSNIYITKRMIGEENVFVASPVVDKSYDMDDLDVTEEVIKIWDEYYQSVKKEVLEFVKK